MLGEAETGVPDYVFTRGFQGVVATQHQRNLRCHVDESELRIVDTAPIEGAAKYNTFGMDVYTGVTLVRGRPEPLRTMRFSVLTRHPLAMPVLHPDLRAAALLSRTISYFEEDGGRPVNALLGQWYADEEIRTNFNAYYQALGMSHEAATPEQREAAAFATWTGQRALDHNFTKAFVQKRDIGSGEHILANFVRESV